MDKYKIYCTEEQTRKAFELGAPLVELVETYFHEFVNIATKDSILVRHFEIPTSEEMIGWLEDQKIYFSINCIRDYVYEVWIKDSNNNGKVIINSCVPSRKEATLAAIDKALEYLSNK